MFYDSLSLEAIVYLILDIGTFVEVLSPVYFGYDFEAGAGFGAAFGGDAA